MYRIFKLQAACLIMLFLLLQVTANAQTKPCDLTFQDGSSFTNTKLVGQYEDLILVTEAQTYKILNIRKIKSIRFDNGTYLWTGVGVGAAVGFLGGIVLYEVMTKKKSSFLTRDASLGVSVIITIPCAIFGALIGNQYRNIDNYDLSDMGTYMKAKEIKFIMRDHSEWR